MTQHGRTKPNQNHQVPVTLGRIHPLNPVREALHLIGVVFLICMYVFILTIVFSIITPKDASFIPASVPFLLFGLAPIILILAVVHLSAPMLRVHKLNWHYLRIYAVLSILFFVYSLVLFFLYTHPVVLLIATVLAILGFSLVPTIRFSGQNLYRSAITVAMACTLLISPTSKSRLESVVSGNFIQSPIIESVN